MKSAWSSTQLDAVSTISYGFTQRATRDAVGPRFLRITDIQDDQVDWENVPFCKIEKGDVPKYRLATDDIVFARTGATTGKSYLVKHPPEAVFASYLIRLRLTGKELLPEFVSLFFQSDAYWDVVKAGMNGSAQGGFNASKLGALVIPVPPIYEQRRIVRILDEAFEGIATAKANAERNLANARALFESQLDQLCGSGATTRETKLLEEVADPSCSLSYGIVQPGDDFRNGTPVVRPTDLTKKFIGIAELKRINPKLAQSYKRTELRGDELLLCVRGSTGALSIALPELSGANVTRGIVPIRFNPRQIDPRYGYYAMRSGAVQSQVKERTYGAALMQINIRDLRKLELRVPSLKEQSGLAQKLDELTEAANRLEALHKEKESALAALKKSLLHRAFTGQL